MIDSMEHTWKLPRDQTIRVRRRTKPASRWTGTTRAALLQNGSNNAHNMQAKSETYQPSSCLVGHSSTEKFFLFVNKAMQDDATSQCQSRARIEAKADTYSKDCSPQQMQML